jgi:hypothetical protein
VTSITPRLIEGFQDLTGPRPHHDAFCQIHPADRAGGVDQKLGRARDIGALRPGAGMQHVVTPNHPGILVGEQWKLEAEPLALAAIDLRRVDADANHANAARVEFRKLLLKTPQLGVTKWSPEPAIKNQDRAFRTGKQISQRDRFAILVR